VLRGHRLVQGGGHTDASATPSGVLWPAFAARTAERSAELLRGFRSRRRSSRQQPRLINVNVDDKPEFTLAFLCAFYVPTRGGLPKRIGITGGVQHRARIERNPTTCRCDQSVPRGRRHDGAGHRSGASVSRRCAAP
jgi:hypothetical protein